ncbi:MAG: Holliday junction resolvase RuvX [bacterium]
MPCAMYTPRMQILGVDLGDRRIGLAISDPSERIALGAGFLEVRSRSEGLSSLSEFVARNGIDEVVVGLPLTMSGERGERARITERFVEQLAKVITSPIRLWDERFTSDAARRSVVDAGPGARRAARRHRGRTDEIAATLLLQSWLDSRCRASDQER